MKVGRYPKFLKPGEPTPSQAKFVCKTCNQWFASTTGKNGHLLREPGHVLVSPHTGREFTKAGSIGRPLRKGDVPSNGHQVLDATARDLLLDYILGKAKEELNAELERMFRELKSQPIPAKGPRRTYVAR
jgi:hypothetical protein